MKKILVAGGLRPEFKEGNAEEDCARALGRAIASNGYVLLNGSYNTFDRLIAEAAWEVAQQQSEPPRVCRRLQLLRRWSHEQIDKQQILA